ncbi:TPA_asm: mobilization protein [Listeria monocytogenes]|uniref:mobilization protein n=1 Tax=Vagococcus fluvialis TaxID=2738 RepID=UPI0010E664FC|nr:mobilization protein [Listeria monocytogenes]HAB8995843.1 mobilization protein [Listeria monocytogenes]
MTRDEQLIIQVLNAYKDGKIDFSNVPELDRIVRQEVSKEFREYRSQMTSLTEQNMNGVLQEIKEEAQQKLICLDTDVLTKELLKKIRTEKEDLLALKKEILTLKEQTNADIHREALESYGIIIANIICLLSFLVVGVLLGQWIYKGIWNGWGLHILFDTIKNIQPEHPYGAIVLGIVGFSLIALGIYGSFRLMYEASTTWLDQRPKIFKKIFPKK